MSSWQQPSQLPPSSPPNGQSPSTAPLSVYQFLARTLQSVKSFSTAICLDVSSQWPRYVRAQPWVHLSMESTQVVNFSDRNRNFLLLPFIFSPVIICSLITVWFIYPSGLCQLGLFHFFLIRVDGTSRTIWDLLICFSVAAACSEQ